MTVSELFSEFVSNLAITNTDTIGTRYGELTSALNKQFRDTDSKTANTLQVGSFGRRTGINGISDLDMLYIMPKGKWADYKDGKQLKLLQDAKSAILKRYPSTKVRVDRLVVTVTYANFHIEVQPVFEQDDRSYLYPDTKNGGSWKNTKPREEMEAFAAMDSKKNANLRRLCKMARAWRNQHGVAMGGLLVDTLAYKFLDQTSEYDSRGYASYDWLSRDFFKFLSELPEQNEYAAPGSRQRVKVKKRFQRKAKKAYKLCLRAIEAEGSKGVNAKWKKVYGRPFPAAPIVDQEALAEAARMNWENTEELIEYRYPIDIKEFLKIDCEVKQSGDREFSLRRMLAGRTPLRTKRSLRFHVSEISVEPPFEVYWKVLNRGDEARRRNCIRGQIMPDTGGRQRKETTDFQGDHIVECYCVKDGVVVAKDRILVPIIPEASGDE
ncbi:MAG: nucleotidyltransferase [Gammaproteobacteria bacterium]|nr:nucleotidyltransferase [Gammaproteobacteria bacterium]